MGAARNKQAFQEHRPARRSRVYRQARCVFNEQKSDLDTLIRNLSATGACISGFELRYLPDEFELWIHDGFGDYKKRRVRRMWAHGDHAGLAFIDGK
jgi:hypothetical protein